MPRLSSITSGDVVKATVEYGGETINLDVDRAHVTPAWAKQLALALEGDDPTSAGVALSNVVVAWDVLDDNDQPLPITGDTLSLFPLALISLLFKEIGGAVVPSRAEGNDSSGRSSTPPGTSTSQEQKSPNGQAASTSPEPLASPSPI